MDFHYEALDYQKFQKLCQALIVAQYPNTQCFPVGQPDGGRDAVNFHGDPNQNEFTVFQVKFSLNPNDKTEGEVIQALIISESEKVKKLISRGATRYVLMTNVKGTAHLDSGSIDKANKALDSFGIPSQVWWRDDLDRRLEQKEAIKWSYPDILKATDTLSLLHQNLLNVEGMRTTRALKGYMTAQYSTDKSVKFKQVELQHSLTDLFVDLPLGRKRPQVDRNRRDRFPVEGLDDISAYIRQLDFDEDYEFESENPFDHSGLAAAFLLKMPLVEGVTRFVLEGAPGQGKSTVTQFLCQVNRLRFLKKNPELESVDDLHKTVPIRVPFRVDLRDYANWMNSDSSSVNVTKSSTTTQGNRSLESFLAHQVKSESGGLEITPDQMLQFFARYHSVIILDGFDEVADIETRKRIVEEICIAAERWDTHIKPCTKSMQIIVTSRPAAFASSPGFPKDSWFYLQLENLRSENIEAYKDKWIKAQNLNSEDGDSVSSTLESKLEQPHLRDLARNPMQLAILLHLIHVQGVALPEKRTTLYEEYMKLFFNREAEKSKVVRDHRELLLSIHGALAWVLHTQAEDGAGSGSIMKDVLHHTVKTYLETEEHDPKLAEELLQGTVERVGALVSRIEGTFEFEVQPLREYFAARYLYKTAPYAPPGKIRKGTRPERFQAIARSLYWTNVTRFFCGFYDVGELDGLVEGLMELGQKDGHNLINRPRHLAMMLLSDQVFSQAPKTMKRLVAFIVGEPDFHRLASMMEFRSDMGLPAKAGGNELFETCGKKLAEENNPSRRRMLRTVMAANASREKLKSTWRSRFENGLMKGKPLREAMDFGIASQFTPEEIAKFTSGDMDSQLRWLILSNHYKYIVENPEFYRLAKKAFFEDESEFLLRWRHSTDSATVLEVLTELLRPYTLVALYTETETDVTAYAVLGYKHRYFSAGNRPLEQLKQQFVGDPLESFTLFIIDLLSRDVKDWQRKLDPWSELVDRGFDEAPGSFLMLQIAMIATVSRAERGSGIWNEEGFAATKGLASRLFFARQKGGDVGWWRTELAKIKSEEIGHCLAVLLSWGTPDVIAALKTEIGSLIEKLSSRDWSHLWSMVTMVSIARREYSADFPGNRVSIPEDWFQAAETLSSRTAFLLINRVDDQEATCRLSRKYFTSYDGNDAQILRDAFQTELLGPDEYIIDWNYVCYLSKHARKIGVRILLPHYYYGSRPLRVPEEVAKTVLSDCENHVSQLVAICEQNYATKVEQSVARVSQVAETEDWDIFQDK